MFVCDRNLLAGFCFSSFVAGIGFSEVPRPERVELDFIRLCQRNLWHTRLWPPCAHTIRAPIPELCQGPGELFHWPQEVGWKKEKGPTPEEAIQKLKETEKILIKKQEFLEQKIQQELQMAKKHGTKNKRAALQALRRKKRFEQQLAQTDGTLSTLEFQREAIENATTNAEVLRTMELAAQGMKKAYQDMDIDKVDELMADITEQQEVAQQISDAISRPVGFDVDEDELLEELEKLEQEELARELLHVGDKEEEPPIKLPGVPSTHLPEEPAPKADEDEETLKQLAEWVS
ncbi:charged multivesicular body protein 4a isoform X1 [Herpailurus yagouaroundi]|uniref:charged multivesicular body protein 4a isoform X1 n=1 Tax=Herpailurus yagouaroundi TaxID=1608482 RepID=UPI001AD77B0C|nr:charged multivesicular body protein 4a isoform X1 [Puma yagouaroundi]